GVVGQIAHQSADFDVAGLTDDDRVPAVGDELGDRQVYTLYQGAGRVVYLVALVAHLQLDPTRRAVRRQQHRPRLHLLRPLGTHRPHRVQLVDDVRVVHEVAEDGQRPLP